MNLIGIAQPVPPPWEPEQGWRVLTPDGQQVSAGGISYAVATFDLAAALGLDADQVPLLDGQERR